MTVATGKSPQPWLTLVCEQCAGARFGLLLSVSEDRSKLSPMARWPESFRDLESLRPVVRQVLERREAISQRQLPVESWNAVDVCAVPVTVGERLFGIVIVGVDAVDDAGFDELPSFLQKQTSWLALGVGGPRRRMDEQYYQSIVALLASCFEEDSYERCVVSLVSRLTREFDCDRVAFGEYRRHFSRVAAVSNSASFDTRSRLIRQIAACMDEAIDQDRFVVFPDSSGKRVVREHAALADTNGYGTILTVPLVHDGQVLGAVTLMKVGDTPFSDDRLRLCEQSMAMLAPHMALLKERDQGITARLLRATWRGLGRVFGVRYLGAKLVTLGLAAVLVAASLLSVSFRITADAALEGQIQRVIAAPFDGYLLSAQSRAGDSVTEGSVIATLNDSELRLQLTRLDGELQKARREYRDAQSKRDLVRVRTASEQINQVRARIELAERQLASTRLLAPFDGVIIDGDLNELLGAPVERGEPLFKLAPLNGYRIIVKVAEQDIGFIEEGQRGRLILPSLPGEVLDLEVRKITAAASVENGANIFRVEAALTGNNASLRPGMQGVAKIEAGEARLLWIWTRDVIDRLRLALWAWLP